MVGSRRLNRKVFLWTDLQRSGVGTPAGEGFPPRVDVEIIDVGRALTKNLAVEEAQAEGTELGDGKKVSVAARVFNAGLFPVQDVRVKLSLDGLPAIEQTATVEGHSRRWCGSKCRFASRACITDTSRFPPETTSRSMIAAGSRSRPAGAIACCSSTASRAHRSSATKRTSSKWLFGSACPVEGPNASTTPYGQSALPGTASLVLFRIWIHSGSSPFAMYRTSRLPIRAPGEFRRIGRKP